MLSLFTLIAAAGVAPTTPMVASHTLDAAPPAHDFRVLADDHIEIDGEVYLSWDEVAQSGYFYQINTRCGTAPVPAGDFEVRGNGADCSFSNTNPAAQYAPEVVKYRIPVVVHVIQTTSGTGAMNDARVRSQIDILNEDFLALPGTNGAPGTDVQIEFYLATEDPNGNPTTGITRSTNNTWFNDGGSYWNTLAWDTNRYLNIYSNSASGNLGYVPGLPQGGIVGSDSDRVVVLYSTFGRNAPLSPFNLGRTATHEVGHYLGLNHTFSGGCAGGNCNRSGDLICDTNPESSPTFGCPGNRTSCGLQAPFRNYMDYADDVCMNQFTFEQARRMRCTLENYRANLYSIANEGCGDADLVEPFGALDVFDILGFLDLFNANAPGADFNASGSADIFDVLDYLAEWEQGCP